MPRTPSYTLLQLRAAVAGSTSVRGVLSKLAITYHSGNYKTVNSKIAEHSIPTNHFTGQGWSNGVTRGRKRPLDEYLSNERPIPSAVLKKRILDAGLIDRRCGNPMCAHTTWNDQPIPLELDHIDGNNQNNTLDNLRLLCPNCHSQTPTYRGKNRKDLLTDEQRDERSKKYAIASKRWHEINRPPKNPGRGRRWRYEGHDLVGLYNKHKNYEKIGRMFNVSGAAIKRLVRRATRPD